MSGWIRLLFDCRRRRRQRPQDEAWAKFVAEDQKAWDEFEKMKELMYKETRSPREEKILADWYQREVGGRENPKG